MTSTTSIEFSIIVGLKVVLYPGIVTPQVRHPERVFLREGSPGSGTVSNISIGINLSIQGSMH